MREGAGLQIIAVSLSDDSGHEQITHVQWQSASSSGITMAQAVIAWLGGDRQNEAWLTAGEERIPVEVVTPIGAPAHLRSRAGGQWGAHLLALLQNQPADVLA